MFYTIRSSVFASPTTYFNQAATSLSSALRKTAGKVADLVFTQTSHLVPKKSVMFPLSLATLSFGNIAYGSFKSNLSLIGLGAITQIYNILYLRGRSRNTSFLKNLSTLRPILSQAISDLTEDRKTVLQVKNDIQPFLTVDNLDSTPGLTKDELIDYLTQKKQRYQNMENADSTEVYNLIKASALIGICGFSLQLLTAPSEAHLG